MHIKQLSPVSLLCFAGIVYLHYKTNVRFLQAEPVHLKHVFHQMDNYTNDELCEAAKFLAEERMVT